MTAKNAAEAFYNGELEAELRRLGKENTPFFSDRDRENHMELVESLRSIVSKEDHVSGNFVI